VEPFHALDSFSSLSRPILFQSTYVRLSNKLPLVWSRSEKIFSFPGDPFSFWTYIDSGDSSRHRIFNRVICVSQYPSLRTSPLIQYFNSFRHLTGTLFIPWRTKAIFLSVGFPYIMRTGNPNSHYDSQDAQIICVLFIFVSPHIAHLIGPIYMLDAPSPPLALIRRTFPPPLQNSPSFPYSFLSQSSSAFRRADRIHLHQMHPPLLPPFSNGPIHCAGIRSFPLFLSKMRLS